MPLRHRGGGLPQRTVPLSPHPGQGTAGLLVLCPHTAMHAEVQTINARIGTLREELEGLPCRRLWPQSINIQSLIPF